MPIVGPISQETLDVGATAVSLTGTTAKGVVPAAAYMTVEEAAVRYCMDGTTATADVGQLALVGSTIELKNRGEVAGFSAIRDGADNGRLNVTLATDWKP